MSRTPGASCLLDARTAAIAQDYIISTNPCAPGVQDALARRQRLGITSLLANCEPPVCGYDRGKDMASAVGAGVIVATIIGIIHSFPIFIPLIALEYNAGYLESCIIGALTYLVMLLTACMSYPIIEYAGHRLTALFGMILLFIGLLVDSQVFHISCLYIGNIFCVGVGGGFAYAASMSLPSDLFRAKLSLGTMVLCIAGSLGTVFYTWFIMEVSDILGYKWTKLMLAILVLFFTLAVHVYPKTRLMYATRCDPVVGSADKSLAIRECVYKAAEDENKCEEPKNCLCVCVCDLRLYNDRSFLLWASLVMVAAMNFYVPYMSIITYADTVGAPTTGAYITVYCLTSVGTRCAFVSNPDFTFTFNRGVFQGSVLLSGIFWIVLSWAQTFGWILMCCLVLGAVEGIICVVASRVAIGTIPRKWIGGAWVSCILCHAFGMFAMSVFTAVISLETRQFFVAFITTGIMQIIVAFLAMLLPNEENEGVDSIPPTTVNTAAVGSMKPGYPARPCVPSYVSPISYSRPFNYRLCTSMGLQNTTYNSYRQVSTGVSVARSTEYKCQCPICSKLGCIPECAPKICVPKGSLVNNIASEQC